MAGDKVSGREIGGYRPDPASRPKAADTLQKGYKPNPQGGHIPTSGPKPAGPPPNQGSGGKKK